MDMSNHQDVGGSCWEGKVLKFQLHDLEHDLRKARPR